ncbi:protein SENSITIVE TO UV [Trifolium repens]|nr:protein SENSITIVE TO UV [Trifolium repens]
MENSDGIIFDDWDDDLLLQIIEAETQAAEAALSSKSKTLSTNPSSSSNHQSQPQQQQQHHHQLQPIDVSVNNFSPPRELSQRPIIRFDSSPPKPISHVNNDIVIDRFKQEHREPVRASKQIINLEKGCLKLNKEKGKNKDQPKFTSSENEEHNVRTKRSKSIDNGRDLGIRAPDHPNASLKYQSGVSSNDLTGFRCVPVETTAKAERVETKIVSHQEAQTAKAKRVETKIASHQGAQDPPSDDLSAYLDLSQKLLAVCGSPSEKMVGSDVISKLFTSCQKDIHNLFGCTSMSPPSEITRKLLTDVSSSRVPLHYVNENNTPEAAKVSRLYHSLTKIADGTDVLETLIVPLLDLCSMENVVIVHCSLRILHTLLKLLLESEKNFGRRDNVFVEGICVRKGLLDSDGLGGVKDGKPFNDEISRRKECWNYQSALQQPCVNWYSIFDIMHQISTRITEENVRVQAVSIMILLFLRSTAYFERETFSQNTVFKTISELLKKDAGLRVRKKILKLLYLVLNCPKLLATFCCGCKEGDSRSAIDDNASASDFQNFQMILEGLDDCVASCGGGLLELKICRKTILVLAFLASSGQPGFEIFIGHRLSTRDVNYLMLILQLLVSEMDREARAYNELPEIFRERTFLMREILILLNRLVSSPSYSATVLCDLANTRHMASWTLDVAIRLSQKGNENEQQDGLVKQIRKTEIIDLARIFKKRVLT